MSEGSLTMLGRLRESQLLAQTYALDVTFALLVVLVIVAFFCILTGSIVNRLVHQRTHRRGVVYAMHTQPRGSDV